MAGKKIKKKRLTWASIQKYCNGSLCCEYTDHDTGCPAQKLQEKLNGR